MDRVGEGKEVRHGRVVEEWGWGLGQHSTWTAPTDKQLHPLLRILFLSPTAVYIDVYNYFEILFSTYIGFRGQFTQDYSIPMGAVIALL